MLRIILFIAFFSSLVICQQDTVKQITNLPFDCRNVAFFAGAFELEDFSPENESVLFEGGNDSISNIFLLEYDSKADTFINLLQLNKASGKNKNPVGFYWYDGSKYCRTVLWETFNGNDWDVMAVTDSGTGWREPYPLLNTPDDEKEISLSTFSQNSTDHFIYTKNNSVCLYTISSKTNEVLFEGNDTVSYSSGNLAEDWELITAAAEEHINGFKSKVVFLEKKSNDSNWSSIKRLDIPLQSGKPYVFYDWTYRSLFYETIINDKKHVRVVPIEEVDNPLYYEYLTEDTTLESYSYMAISFPVPVYKTSADYYTSWPFAYMFNRNDSCFVQTSVQSSYPILRLYTRVKLATPVPGYTGISPNYKIIFYTIWEDSSANNINLFGTKNYLLLGDVENTEELSFRLSQNYPNPFNPVTTINYSIKTRGNVNLKVYDILGKEVATLVNEDKQAGDYEVTFNGSNLSSGVYIYRMTSGEYTHSKKLILLK